MPENAWDGLDQPPTDVPLQTRIGVESAALPLPPRSTAIPEESTALLLMSGLAIMVASQWLRRRRDSAAAVN
jgi:hypothetical protein